MYAVIKRQRKQKTQARRKQCSSAEESGNSATKALFLAPDDWPPRLHPTYLYSEIFSLLRPALSLLVVILPDVSSYLTHTVFACTTSESTQLIAD